MNPQQFGAQIRQRRREKHLSIDEFAQLLGATRYQIVEME